MRNLKKILALVMALVMSMSLVTIANAADFTDNDDISYEEAADVMNAIGVIEGYEDGSFDPNGTLVREEAATLVTRMLLGDNAGSLGIERSTFDDVLTTRWSAPAIEYCVSLGIIDGAGDGNFYPRGQLTAVAFAKVLLTAIGYDSDSEGLVGTSWSINTSALAAEVGLDNGIEDLTWSAAITREQAAQMALNAIQAPLVAYESGVTVVVGDTPVSFGSGDAYYITTTLAREQRISDVQLSNSNDYTVEFGERYFPNLRLVRETDEFERPSHTWVYESQEIGSYVDYDLLVETYTEGVDGRTLYELLGRTTIQDYGLTYYVDGVVTTLNKNDLVRSNTQDVGATGNGVLTQVFVDHDDEEIIITSINTYLAQANADYSESTETVSLNVFTTEDGVTRTVDSVDVPEAADVTADQFMLVNMSGKDRTNNRLEVVKISDVEIITDATVTKFSTSGGGDATGEESLFTEVTADGEAYSANAEAHYDVDVLNLYDNSLLTDMSYNIYLDQYGYAIGVDLFEGELNYVFITGYDRISSNISIRTARAAAIFLDGRMEEITVNVTNTNKNINRLDTDGDGILTDDTDYYAEWTNNGAADGDRALNRWYSYTENNGTYTLRPVDMFYSNLTDEPVINSANVRLNDEHDLSVRAYGNDDSIYIIAEAGQVDTSTGDDAITDVSGLYTGVQNVDIKLTDEARADVTEANVYTVYDDDNYIIASIVLGEAQGSVANYAYILTSAKSEGIEDGYYYWEFDAVLAGEIVTLTARSEYSDTFYDLKKGTVQELRFDGDYVVGVEDVDDIYTNNTREIKDERVYFVTVDNVHNGTDGILYLRGNTLYSDTDDVGLAIVNGAPAVVIQDVNNKTDVKTEYGSVSEAIAALGDPSSEDGLQYQGKIIAVLDDLGRAEWVIFDSNTPVSSSNQGGFTDNGSDTRLPSYTDLPVSVVRQGTTIQTGNGRYDASTGTLYLQFTGLTDGASVVDMGQILVQDSFGSGRYYTLNDVDVIRDDAAGTETSYVVELDFTATELTGNYIVLNNTITVTTGATSVEEWYVKYNGTAKEAITGPTTMKNNTTDVVTWTVKMPEGVTTYGITNNGTDNLDAVDGLGVDQAGLSTDATIKCKLIAVGTQPILGVDYSLSGSQVTYSASVEDGAYDNAKGIVGAYFAAPTGILYYDTASQNVTLTVAVPSTVTASGKRIAVEYEVNGEEQDAVYKSAATGETTIDLPIPQDATEGAVTIEVTSVKLQGQVAYDAAITGTWANSVSDSLDVSIANVASGSDYVDVGHTLKVNVTAAAGDISGNGIKITFGGVDKVITAASNTVTFDYTVAVGSNDLRGDFTVADVTP